MLRLTGCVVLLTGALLLVDRAEAGNRIIEFAGKQWLVRNTFVPQGPGPNLWSDSTESVFVDGQGRLHLKIRQIGGQWHSSQVSLLETLDYGDYRFQLSTNTEQFDPNAVAGLFMFHTDIEEIDIELSKWGDPQNTNTGQFVVQPFANPGNLERFPLNLSGSDSTHRFNWQPNSIFFQSSQGHQDSSPPPGQVIHEFMYTGADIPPLAPFALIDINLWLVNGTSPTDGQEVELIVNDFAITPLLLGDANNDGQITGADLIAVQQNFGEIGAADGLLLGDANDDGQVTGADLIAVQQNFGNVFNPKSSSVPESSTLALLSLGTLLARRRGSDHS